MWHKGSGTAWYWVICNGGRDEVQFAKNGQLKIAFLKLEGVWKFKGQRRTPGHSSQLAIVPKRPGKWGRTEVRRSQPRSSPADPYHKTERLGCTEEEDKTLTQPTSACHVFATVCPLAFLCQLWSFRVCFWRTLVCPHPSRPVSQCFQPLGTEEGSQTSD